MKWFAVHGRVPKDDDDTVMVIEAADSNAARAEFRRMMTDGRSADEIAETDSQFDSNGGVYIMTILESDTEIREIQ